MGLRVDLITLHESLNPTGAQLNCQPLKRRKDKEEKEGEVGGERGVCVIAGESRWVRDGEGVETVWRCTAPY